MGAVRGPLPPRSELSISVPVPISLTSSTTTTRRVTLTITTLGRECLVPPSAAGSALLGRVSSFGGTASGLGAAERVPNPIFTPGEGAAPPPGTGAAARALPPPESADLAPRVAPQEAVREGSSAALFVAAVGQDRIDEARSAFGESARPGLLGRVSLPQAASASLSPQGEKQAQQMVGAMAQTVKDLPLKEGVEGVAEALHSLSAALDTTIAAAPAEDRANLLLLKASCLRETQFIQGTTVLKILFKETSFGQAVLAAYQDEFHSTGALPSLLQPSKENRATLQLLANILQDKGLQKSVAAILKGPITTTNALLASLLKLQKPSMQQSLPTLPRLSQDPAKSREALQKYFSSVSPQATQKFLERYLGPSSPRNPKGVLLLTEGETSLRLTSKEQAQLVPGRPLIKEGLCYLRLSDAGNRIVVLSAAAYQFLQRLQERGHLDRSSIMQRLAAALPRTPIIGHTQSPQGIMNTLGTLYLLPKTVNAQQQPMSILMNMMGIRITCTQPPQINRTIATLQAQGFEILEIGDKYVSPAGGGMARAVPLTVRDPATGSVFKLQIVLETAVVPGEEEEEKEGAASWYTLFEIQPQASETYANPYVAGRGENVQKAISKVFSWLQERDIPFLVKEGAKLEHLTSGVTLSHNLFLETYSEL